MKLSELKTGQKATIKKVSGHGSFRKRIIEMGFIKGQTVEVMLNAPLQDPVKYKVMGYEVSLRRSEAGMIDVSLSAQSRSDNGMPAANGALTGEALTSESHESISAWHWWAIPTAARPRSSTLHRGHTSAWATIRA